MHFLGKALLLVCFAFGYTRLASAKTLYVNNVTGANSNSGLIEKNQGQGAGPLRSIATALKLVGRGDTIEIAKTGIAYEECITIQGRNNSGYEYVPFVIEGNGATLDGTDEIPADEWEFIQGNLFRFKPQHGGYQFLFLDGKPAKQLPRYDGSYLSSFLKPLEWCRCQGGIHFVTAKGKSPYAYDLRYAKHRVGITLYDVSNVVIKNLQLRGFQLDGVNAHDNAMNCTLVNVRSDANGRSGFSINGASRVKLVECQAEDNGEVGLRCDNWSTTELLATKLTAKKRPIWARHVNRRGQGARLIVDGKRQTEIYGWQADAEKPDGEASEQLDSPVLGDEPTPKVQKRLPAPNQPVAPAPNVESEDPFADEPADIEPTDIEPANNDPAPGDDLLDQPEDKMGDEDIFGGEGDDLFEGGDDLFGDESEEI